MQTVARQEDANAVVPMSREIIGEIYRALMLLGADDGLLGTVGSWGDCLSEKEVLSGLKAWNEASLAEIKGRIGHYEMSCPHPACSHSESPRTAAEVR
jgi:hypothetical protein